MIKSQVLPGQASKTRLMDKRQLKLGPLLHLTLWLKLNSRPSWLEPPLVVLTKHTVNQLIFWFTRENPRKISVSTMFRRALRKRKRSKSISEVLKSMSLSRLSRSASLTTNNSWLTRPCSQTPSSTLLSRPTSISTPTWLWHSTSIPTLMPSISRSWRRFVSTLLDSYFSICWHIMTTTLWCLTSPLRSKPSSPLPTPSTE